MKEKEKISKQTRIYDTTHRAVIRGTGHCVPAKILDNAELEAMVDTSDEWITTRTGIKQRRIISDGQTTASLAIEASSKAIATAGLSTDDIDLIVCATITPEMVFPSTACFIQAGLDNDTACAFDLSAACSGFVYGLAVASSMLTSGIHRTALVLGAETLSTITNYTDRTSCILFGDGAGAVVMTAETDSDRGLLYSSLHADGRSWQTLCCQAYGSRNPAGEPLDDPDNIYMTIQGRDTYQLAVRRIVEMIRESYDNCGISNDDIAMIIPHQMNARIIESVTKRLGISQEKMFVNIDKYGNTSSASIPIALDEAVRSGRLKQGELVLLVAFGAGLTWAVNVVRM